ncbi:MAG: DUF2071 domain-containing protein [Pseudolysinimonas sp.]
MPTPAEPITPLTPRPVLRPLLSQSWRDVTFLHWQVAPELVAPLLPPGIRPDALDGVSYVGLIGFRMVGLGFGRGPGIPYLGTFSEINVRLYSVDDRGRRGVVFPSLESSRLLSALAARGGLNLPYMWSAMRIAREGDEFSYVSRRRALGPKPSTSSISVRVGDRIVEPSELDTWLTARWGLHVRAWGRTLHVPNEHPSWPLRRAKLLQLDDTLVAAAGLPSTTAAPVSVLYSEGVHVRFGQPRVVSPAEWRLGVRRTSGR